MRHAALMMSLILTPIAALAQGRGGPARAQEDFNAERAWQSAGWESGDVVVAEVVTVPDDPGTNAAPPTIGLKVARVLRGDPKLDRSKVVWSPAWPFEWGICGNDSRIKPWQEGKFSEMPKVGETYLLLVEHDARNPGLCRADGNTRGLFTDEFEKQALEWYEAGAKRGRDYVAAKAAEEKRVRDEAEEFWASKMEGAKLEDLFGQGDFIGVGRISSGGGNPVAHFQVTELLRGPRMHEYVNNAYFGSMFTPKGGENAFPDQTTQYLLVLTARGTECPVGGGGPFYEVLPGDRGVLPLTDANLAAAREWCRTHAADPAVEKEIVARCAGWTAARNAARAFQWIDTSLKYGDKFRPLADQDTALAQQLRHAENSLLGTSADAQARARLDKDFRAILTKALLLRAGVLALRAAGLAERDGAPKAIEPADADKLRSLAFTLLHQAVRETDVTKERLEADADLKGLKEDFRWALMMERVGK